MTYLYELSYMISKIIVGLKDHHYLNEDIVIPVVPFDQMMGRHSASLFWVDIEIIHDQQKFITSKIKSGLKDQYYQKNIYHVLPFPQRLIMHVLLLEIEQSYQTFTQMYMD